MNESEFDMHRVRTSRGTRRLYVRPSVSIHELPGRMPLSRRDSGPGVYQVFDDRLYTGQGENAAQRSLDSAASHKMDPQWRMVMVSNDLFGCSDNRLYVERVVDTIWLLSGQVSRVNQQPRPQRQPLRFANELRSAAMSLVELTADRLALPDPFPNKFPTALDGILWVLAVVGRPMHERDIVNEMARLRDSVGMAFDPLWNRDKNATVRTRIGQCLVAAAVPGLGRVETTNGRKFFYNPPDRRDRQSNEVACEDTGPASCCPRPLLTD